MYVLTPLLTTIAGCSVTIIAIIGGFIARKLISNSSERHQVTTQINEINEEILYRQTLLEQFDKNFRRVKNSPDASGPKKHDSGVVDSGVVDSGVVDSDVADSGVADSGVADSGVVDSDVVDSDVADSGVVDSDVVDSGVVDSDVVDSGVVDSDVADSQKRDFFSDCPNSLRYEHERIMQLSTIELAQMRRKNAILRLEALNNPHGMKMSLLVFVTYSVLGVFVPMFLIPFQTTCYALFLVTKLTVIFLFAGCMAFVYYYLLYLLRWKNKDVVQRWREYFFPTLSPRLFDSSSDKNHDNINAS